MGPEGPPKPIRDGPFGIAAHFGKMDFLSDAECGFGDLVVYMGWKHEILPYTRDLAPFDVPRKRHSPSIDG